MQAMTAMSVLGAVAFLMAAQAPVASQGRGGAAGGRGGAAGGRGGGAAQPAPTAQAAAPVDLTGYWVSYVTEDWRFRMVQPPRGDYESVPLNATGRRTADSWDPNAPGDPCLAYGPGFLMRQPGRLHITWQDTSTLRIDFDAGTQTRLLHFGDVRPATTPTLQGNSSAKWYSVRTAGARGGGPPPGETLKVVTTGMRPGFLRTNGVPFSRDAVITEYFNRIEEINGDVWLVVMTVVEDPTYLNAPFLTSTNFKLQPDNSGWRPMSCAEHLQLGV
jgi:hypothetical protein